MENRKKDMKKTKGIFPIASRWAEYSVGDKMTCACAGACAGTYVYTITEITNSFISFEGIDYNRSVLTHTLTLDTWMTFKKYEED